MNKLFLIIDQNQYLYEILKEIIIDLQYEIINGGNRIDEEINKIISNNNDYLILTNKNTNKYEKTKSIFLSKPIKIKKLLEIINLMFLRNKYSETSNISIGNYNLDLNSRTMSFDNKKLKLTEKELNLIMYLFVNETEKKSFDIRKDVWGYSDGVETHTVETHIYRLRKKIIEKFNDKKFLSYEKNGYKLLWKNETHSPNHFFLKNISKGRLDQKKVREVLKEKKNKTNL